MVKDDNGPSFDYILDPEIKMDDEELAMLAMELVFKIKEILDKNPQYYRILVTQIGREKTKDFKSTIKEIGEKLLLEYEPYLELHKQTLGKVGLEPAEFFLGIIDKALRELKNTGTQENAEGIGLWSWGKTLKINLKYWGRRIRGNSKGESLKKQLDDWKYEFRTEKKVRDTIKKEDVGEDAKQKRINHWDRRILLKSQKIREKTEEIKRELKTQKEKNIKDVSDEIKKLT